MTVGIFLFQAVAFAVLTGIVARNKDRNPVGWGVLGFLFGPFAFIAALVVEEAEQAEVPTSSQRQNQSSGAGEFNPEEHEKKCPVCAEYIKLEARGCKHCGHEFSEEEVRDQISKVREELRDQAKDDFHYGKLSIYTHTSVLISFLISISLLFYGFYIIWDFLSSGSISPNILEVLIGAFLSLSMVVLGSIFIYSSYRVYTNNIYGLFGFMFSIPFYMLYFTMIGLFEFSTAYSGFYSYIRIIFSITAVLVILSVYYLYRKSYNISTSYYSDAEHEKGKRAFGLSSLSLRMKKYLIGEVLTCISFILFISAAIMGFFII